MGKIRETGYKRYENELAQSCASTLNQRSEMCTTEIETIWNAESSLWLQRFTKPLYSIRNFPICDVMFATRITMTSWWAWWRLKLPATRLFFHPFVQAKISKNGYSKSLSFVRGIHRWPVNSPYKRPVTRKMFPFDYDIMIGVVSYDIVSWPKLFVCKTYQF